MDEAQRIQALISWAASHNAHLHPSVEIYNDAQTGLSFRVKPSATTPPSFLDAIVSVPTRLTLSYLNALEEDADTAFPEAFLAQTPPHVVGRFFLVKQFLLEDKSFWWPYIHLLPQPERFETWTLPPFWPADERELLDGTNVEVGINLIKHNVKKEFNAAFKSLSSESWRPDLLEKLSLPLYQWAYSIFSSRSFRPSLVLAHDDNHLHKSDDYSVLVPLLDIGNHDMTAEVVWDVDEAHKILNLKVAKEHQPGDQIFNNYSLKTNAELLLGYGFMIPPTEDLHNDYIHVRKRQAASPSEPSSSSPSSSSQEYYISLKPLNHPSSLLGRSKQATHVSDATTILAAFQHVQHDMVWDIFCTIAPPEQRAALIPGAGDDQQRRDWFFSGRVSEAGRPFLQQTAGIIQHKVFQELERLEESDVDIVGDGELTRNQKLALEYRERCRQVLENTLEAMNSDGLFDE